MSLENAIAIFTKRGFSDSKWAIDIIQKAGSLDELRRIMIDECAGSQSEDQFVSFRIKALFDGDPEFSKRTLKNVKEILGEYNLPEEIVNLYISDGGGADTGIMMVLKMDMGQLPKIEDKNKLHSFYTDANNYLFKALKEYVNEHTS